MAVKKCISQAFGAHWARRGLALVLVGGVAGCAPEGYRRSADLQVDELIKDRQQSTLGYTPGVEVGQQIPPQPPRQAYSKLPTSPPPPPTSAPMERDHVELPAGPLGPEERILRTRIQVPETSSQEVLDNRYGRIPVYGPPTPEHQVRKLDLFGVLEYAVQNSRSYRDRMDQLYVSALDVTLQRHLFDLRPFARQEASYNEPHRTRLITIQEPGRPDRTVVVSDADYTSALRATTGVRQKLPYGGEIVADSVVNLVHAVTDNITDSQTARLALSGSIPLLRGAGMINLEPLIDSERQLVYDVRSFEDFRRQFVVNIASQYWDLLQLQQGLVNRRQNLINTTMLTVRAQALYDAGRMKFLDVQRALQSQFQAERSLIEAEDAYQSALDRFKLTIGMSPEEAMDVAAVELDVPLPQINAEAAVNLAHTYRLDLRTASDQIEDARRGIKNAENGLRPDLNVTARGELGGDSEVEGSFADSENYSASVSLDLPIDRVAERNQFRRSLIGWEAAQRRYAELRDAIANDVRAALRAIHTAELSVEIQRQSIELAEKRIELASELLKQGKVDTREVVDAQTALLDAQDGYERARSQLRKRILEYMRETGTLRVDPAAGTLGQVMHRPGLQANSGQAK